MDEYTTLIPRTTYEHTNTSQYLCKEVLNNYDAVLERVTDKWTLVAHGTRMTSDGKIHWNYSTGGHWNIG